LFEALRNILAADLNNMISKRNIHAGKSVVFLVISRFLDIVSSNHRRISVLIVAFPFDEIDLSKELLLMMLEFADHIDGFGCNFPVVEALRGGVKTK
jgi:hypothetical protein